MARTNSRQWLIGTVRVKASLRYVPGPAGEADFELTARGIRNVVDLKQAWHEGTQNGWKTTLRPVESDVEFDVTPVEIVTSAKLGKSTVRFVPVRKRLLCK